MHVRGMYREWKLGHTENCKIEITLKDITSSCLLSSSQEPSKCLLDKISKLGQVEQWSM